MVNILQALLSQLALENTQLQTEALEVCIWRSKSAFGFENTQLQTEALEVCIWHSKFEFYIFRISFSLSASCY